MELFMAVSKVTIKEDRKLRGHNFYKVYTKE